MSFEGYTKNFGNSKNIDGAPKYLGLATEEIEVLVLKKHAELGVLRLINKILLLVIVCALGVMVSQGDQGVLKSHQEQIQKFEKMSHVTPTTVETKIRDVFGVSEYQKRVEKRHLFHPSKKMLSKKIVNLQQSSQLLRKKIKIVGIMLDGDPTAVVEDIRSKSTVFMKVGESIQDARLIEIFADKVIFSFQGTRVEIIP